MITDLRPRYLQIKYSETQFSQTIQNALATIQSASGVDWEMAITPSSNLSKVKLELMISFSARRDGILQPFGSIIIERKIGTGSFTEIYRNQYVLLRDTDADSDNIYTHIKIDQPNTSETITYRVRANTVATNNNRITTNRLNAISTWTISEVIL